MPDLGSTVRALIEPGAAWKGGFNVSEQAMRERRESLDVLHPEDVAQVLLYGFAQRAHVLVEELLVRPVRQISPDRKFHSRVTGQLGDDLAVAASAGAPDGTDRLGMADRGDMRGWPHLLREARRRD